MPETLKTYENRCRCCLEKFFENEKISKITNFFGFQFFAFTCLPESEHLSQFVCEFCHSELLRFSVFKKDLIEKQQKLNDLLKHHNDKIQTREQKSKKHNKKVFLISDESEGDENDSSAADDSDAPGDEPEEDSDTQNSPSESDDDKDQDFGKVAIVINGVIKSEFTCDYCGSAFKAKQGLTRHVQSHINLSVPWKCGFVGCDFAGSSKVKLNLHKHEKHDVPYVKTEPTNKKAQTKRLSTTLACFCGASFPTPFSLRAHRNRMHGRKNKCIYGCADVQYVKRGHFLRHVQFKHPEKLEECLTQRNGILTKLSSASLESYEIFICDQCDFKTLKKSAMKVHIQTHLPYLHRTKFECKKCHKLFTREASLRNHEKVHGDARKLKSLESPDQPGQLNGKKSTKKKCDICDRLFNKRSALESHQRNSHSSAHQKPLIVSAFSATLSEAKVDRRFKCHCGKTFPYKSRLSKHQLKHLKDDPDVQEKIFKCPEPGCKHSFTQRCNLVRHQKAKQHLKEEDLENLKYSCSCGEKFFSVRGFAFHTEKSKCKN